MSTSMRPNRSTAALTAASASTRLVTSSLTASRSFDCLKACDTRLLSRAVATTACPAAKAAFAKSTPIPRLAPVMNQTLLLLIATPWLSATVPANSACRTRALLASRLASFDDTGLCLSVRLGIISDRTAVRAPSAIRLGSEERFRRIVRCLAVLGDTAAYGCGKCGFQLHGVVVLGVARRARLLAPGLLDPAGIDRIEAEFVHQAQHLRAHVDGIAGDRKCNAVGCAFRAPIFKKALEVDVVECLDDWTADLLGDPRALRLTILDRTDATVTTRVVVAGVDHDDLSWHARKQIPRQVWHGPFGNGDHHNFAAARRLVCRHGGGPGLRCQVTQRLWSSRVRDGDLVTEVRESPRECFTDHPGADDSDIHV